MDAFQPNIHLATRHAVAGRARDPRV